MRSPDLRFCLKKFWSKSWRNNQYLKNFKAKFFNLMILIYFMKAVKIWQQHPVLQELLKFLFIEWSNGKILLLWSFRFWLFLQLLLKIFFDLTSLNPSRSKIRIFWRDGLPIWLPLLNIWLVTVHYL